jgi:hypothetical protein
VEHGVLLHAGLTPLDLDLMPRFTDMVTVPDGGIGPAPVVDRGCYEAQGVGVPAATVTSAGTRKSHPNCPNGDIAVNIAGGRDMASKPGVGLIAIDDPISAGGRQRRLSRDRSGGGKQAYGEEDG